MPPPCILAILSVIVQSVNLASPQLMIPPPDCVAEFDSIVLPVTMSFAAGLNPPVYIPPPPYAWLSEIMLPVIVAVPSLLIPPP